MTFIAPFNMLAPDTAPRLAAALPLWERAAYRAEVADAFCSGPDWQLACHAVFEPARRLYLKCGGDSVLALAERRYLNGARLLVPLDCGWRFGSTLLGASGAELLEETLGEFDALPPWRVPGILLSGLETGPGFASLARRLGRRCRLHKCGDAIMGFASLSGGLDGWLSRRGRHFRERAKSLRLKAKKAGLTFERIWPASPKEAAKAYARMLKIEARSWKGMAGCGMDAEPSRRFYATLLARTSAKRAARIILASLEGEDLGFIFGSCGGKIYRGQQFSYAAEVKSLSLGHVLQLEMMNWLCEDGIERYDPGPCSGPRMQYKCRWIDGLRVISSWILAPLR